MTWPVHVAAAVLVSKTNPVLAVILSLFSHPVLDIALEEAPLNWAEASQVRNKLLWIFWWIVACFLMFQAAPDWGKICILASLLPDLIDGAYTLYCWCRGIDNYGKGDFLMPWHDRPPVSRPKMSLLVTITIEVACTLGALYFLNHPRLL